MPSHSAIVRQPTRPKQVNGSKRPDIVFKVSNRKGEAFHVGATVGDEVRVYFRGLDAAMPFVVAGVRPGGRILLEPKGSTAPPPVSPDDEQEEP